MEVKDIEKGLLKYKETDFIDFIEKSFLDVDDTNNSILKKVSNFFESDTEECDKTNLKDKIYLLSLVDEKIKSHVIARLNFIISNYEGSSQLSTVITLALTVLLFVIENFADTQQKTMKFIVALLVIVLAIMLFRLFHLLFRQKSRKDTAVYFKTLLEEIK